MSPFQPTTDTWDYIIRQRHYLGEADLDRDRDLERDLDLERDFSFFSGREGEREKPLVHCMYTD